MKSCKGVVDDGEVILVNDGEDEEGVYCQFTLRRKARCRRLSMRLVEEALTLFTASNIQLTSGGIHR